MSARPVTVQQLNAFVDGELPLDQQLAVEAQLEVDAALQREVAALRALRDAVRERADCHAAPEALRARLGLAVSAPTSTAAAPIDALRAVPRGAWQRWFAWRPMLPAFALAGLAAVVAWGLLPPLPGRDEQQLQEVVASHVRASVGGRLVDVASSDRHTVKPWLSARLDYSPPVADAPVPGAVFAGGRLDYLAGRPVAALVYRQRQHVIDAYVWPTADADSSERAGALRGFNSVHWVRGGMRFWLVSDLNAAELGVFAHALALADAAR